MIAVRNPSTMKKRIFIFLILCFIPLFLNGQQSYRKGSIILDNASVRTGLIRPVKTGGLITSCFFRFGNSSPVEYQPEDIAGFNIEGGRRYVSGESFSAEASGKFLEVLFEGVADLFYYADRSGEHYFISDMNNRIFNISVNRKGKKATENDGISEITAIRAVVKTALSQAPSLAYRIDNLTPDRESLITLMHDFHVLIKGSESAIKYQVPPPVFMIRPEIFAGYSADLFMAENGGTLAGYSVDPSFYPSLGVMLRSPFARINRNFYGTLSLSMAQRYTYGFYTQEITNPNGTIFHELHMHNLLLKSELLFGYSFGTGKIKPSLFAGPLAEYLLDNDSRIDYDTVIDWLILSESESFESDSNIRGGFTAGASILYEINKTFSLHLKASYSILSGDSAFRGVNSFNISTGIIF